MQQRPCPEEGTPEMRPQWRGGTDQASVRRMLGGGASKRGVPETEGNMDRRAGPGGQGPDNGSNDEEFGFCSKCDPFFLKNKLFILKYLGFEN